MKHITTNRQFISPSKLGQQKVNLYSEVISGKDSRLLLKLSVRSVKKLAGSIRLPEDYKGLDPEQIIKRSKEDYFLNNLPMEEAKFCDD